MARQRKEKPRLSGWIERLEDRRVMSADPLAGPPSLELHDADGPPALEHHVESEPDFWIDPSLQTGLDDYLDQVDQMLTQAHNLTGWFNVQNNYGFTGLGQTVAIIDSGIAYNHFALGGGLGANYRVVGGWDFTEENDANPLDDPGSGSHGSHVAGIVGSDNATHAGVAPGVDLVALRVFNDAGQGFFTWVENALRWVINNRTAFENPITAINLSLGVSSWNASTVPAWANLEDEFQQLEAAGVFIAVSAGNAYANFNTVGLSYPAASPFVVPVMSTNDAGQMSSFSQRLGRAIAAPGQNIVSTVPVYDANGNITGHTFASKGGTSMAAPYVAGASVLVRQAMQFVGMTNITQDMIYDHMMATADTFFDSVSNQNYKRLNLARAIDSLMPADDYGSTTATAFNLGTLSGAVTRNGQIARLTDVDCFRFTAGSTGTITFSATVSPGMTRTWQVWGATAGASAPGTLSFNVVAGQSYTIGLSSPTGLGNYSLSSSFVASTPPASLDWGDISFNQFNNVSVSGQRWYRVEATRSGVLTAIGTFNASGGSVNVALANPSYQIIANGTTSGGQARVDANVVAGGVYYLRVTGSNSDVDFKLANLLSQSGMTVTIAGTSGDDVFTFSVYTSFNLGVNGISYAFAGGTANTFQYQGGAGNDTVTIIGGKKAETATLGHDFATIAGAAYSVNATGFENLTIDSGGGGDALSIYDSVGNDILQLAAGYASFKYGDGRQSLARGFTQATAYSSAGFDIANVYDTRGNDAVSLWADRTLMVGSGFTNDARGFDLVGAHAWNGGYDGANFYDSAGDDAFTAWSHKATMAGAGYTVHANGFESALAFASAGGHDVATLYDSAGNDFFAAGPLRAIMNYANGVTRIAQGFEQAIGEAVFGGFDRANMVDSMGNDVVTASSGEMSIAGSNFHNVARGFEEVNALLINGGVDIHDFSATDYLFNMLGEISHAPTSAQHSGGFATSNLEIAFESRLGRIAPLRRR